MTKQIDTAAIAKKFLKDALASEQLTRDGIYSFHIDELIPNVELSESEQITTSVEVYQVLIDEYEPVSNEYMAMLGIGVEDSKTLKTETLETLLAGKLRLVPPPEIYLTLRKEPLEPRVIEEYTLPISQDLIKPKKGSIKAYFRLMRYNPDDDYGRIYGFEHYPLGRSGYDWPV